MKSLPLRLATFALLVALAGAGCGGDDENDKFVEEANRVCTDGNQKIKDAGSNPEALLQASSGLVADLRKVEPPTDKADTYDDLVANYDKFFTDFRAALESQNPKKIDALDETMGDEQARELGLDECIG